MEYFRKHEVQSLRTARAPLGGRALRVLILSHRYSPAARASHLYRGLAEALVARGHEVGVLTKLPADYLPEGAESPSTPPAEREVMNGVEVTRVRGMTGIHRGVFMRGIEHLVLGFAFARALRGLPKPDVVIAICPPLPVALVGAFFAKTSGAPLVLNLHDLYPRTAIELGVLSNPGLIWILRRIERFVYSSPEEIVVTAPGAVDYLVDEREVPADRVTLVQNWVNVSSVRPDGSDNGFRSGLGLGNGFVVTYAGVMGFAQDLSTTIDCARVSDDGDDTQFLLIGDGPLADKWRAQAADVSTVRFLPFMSEDRYFDALRASDVCLVPLIASLASPAIPGKIQSIMAVSRPIVAIVPPESDAARVIEASRCGFVVPPGDVDGLRRVLRQLKAEPQLAEELGANGREYAEANFSLESAALRYERTLEKAVHRVTATTGSQG